MWSQQQQLFWTSREQQQHRFPSVDAARMAVWGRFLAPKKWVAGRGKEGRARKRVSIHAWPRMKEAFLVFRGREKRVWLTVVWGGLPAWLAGWLAGRQAGWFGKEAVWAANDLNPFLISTYLCDKIFWAGDSNNKIVGEIFKADLFSNSVGVKARKSRIKVTLNLAIYHQFWLFNYSLSNLLEMHFGPVRTAVKI